MVQFNQALKDMQDQALKLEALKEEHNAKVSDAELKNFMFLIQKAAGVVKVIWILIDRVNTNIILISPILLDLLQKKLLPLLLLHLEKHWMNLKGNM